MHRNPLGILVCLLACEDVVWASRFVGKLKTSSLVRFKNFFSEQHRARVRHQTEIFVSRDKAKRDNDRRAVNSALRSSPGTKECSVNCAKRASCPPSSVEAGSARKLSPRDRDALLTCGSLICDDIATRTFRAAALRREQLDHSASSPSSFCLKFLRNPHESLKVRDSESQPSFTSFAAAVRCVRHDASP